MVEESWGCVEVGSGCGKREGGLGECWWSGGWVGVLVVGGDRGGGRVREVGERRGEWKWMWEMKCRGKWMLVVSEWSCLWKGILIERGVGGGGCW